MGSPLIVIVFYLAQSYYYRRYFGKLVLVSLTILGEHLIKHYSNIERY